MFRKSKNLIIADKDGNWNLHVDIVWSMMPVSRDFNAVNYLQHAWFYLEKIQVLQHTHPSFYEGLVQGMEL